MRCYFSVTGESSTSGGSSEGGGSFDKTKMAERKRRCLEPDSFEEQELRKSFEVEYNRSFEAQQGSSFDEGAAGGIPPLKSQRQMSSDLESQTSFDTEQLTLRELERPSFDLPEEDHFLRERQKFFERESDSLDLETQTEEIPPPLPLKKGGKQSGGPPTIISE